MKSEGEKAIKADDVRSIMQRTTKKGTLAGLKHTELSTVLNSMEAQISLAVPAGVNPKRVIQMAANLVAKNPKIAECSAASVLGAVMEAAILGFRPVAGLGQCYFVPYGGHVQFQIGYRGWIELARRSGKVKTLYAHCVHEGDVFEYELGLDPKLKHVPGKGGKMTHVYAVAHYTDGGFNFTVLSRDEVEGLRTRNASQRGAPSGPWATDYEEMAKAKAIKRLSKYMPLSDEAAKAMAIDEAFIPESGAISQDGSGLDVDAVEWEVVPENTEEDAK